MKTLKELLTIAKNYSITGRHEMTKDQLNEVILIHELELNAQKPIVSKKDLKEIVRRYPSSLKRDEKGLVVRRGHNISGNLPFKHKYYYFNPTLVDQDSWTPGYKEAYDAAPNQVRGIIKYMSESGLISGKESRLGRVIAENAKSLGYIQSKIPGDKLFAYYRKALELLGVIHFQMSESESELESELTEDENEEN